jgi:hypothetical protein
MISDLIWQLFGCKYCLEEALKNSTAYDISPNIIQVVANTDGAPVGEGTKKQVSSLAKHASVPIRLAGNGKQ